MTFEYTMTELVERARAVLSNAGLVVEDIDLSGELAMCGTMKKPNGTDGRYAVHLDFPPCVWVCNRHNGDDDSGYTVKLYEESQLNAMTAEEKEAMRERIRQEKEAAQARREEERRAAAEKANRLFPTFPPCRKGKRLPAPRGRASYGRYATGRRRAAGASGEERRRLACELAVY